MEEHGFSIQHRHYRLQNGDTVEKVPEVQSPKLDALPPSEDGDFWLEAEIHTGLTVLHTSEAAKQAEENRTKHYFVRTTGRQAQCNHCDWGFELDPGDKIENGHLYDKKGTLVI